MHFGLSISPFTAQNKYAENKECKLYQDDQFNLADLVSEAAKGGFSLIELDGNARFVYPLAFSRPSVEELIQVKIKNGLSFIIDLANWSIDPTALVQPIRSASISVLIDQIRVTQPLFPESYVVDLGGVFWDKMPDHGFSEKSCNSISEKIKSNAFEMLEQLLAETNLDPKKLIIKIDSTLFDLFIEIAQSFHASLYYTINDNLDLSPEKLEKILPRLNTVRFSSVLLSKDIESQRIIEQLQTAGFNGQIILNADVFSGRQWKKICEKIIAGFLNNNF